MFGQLDHLLVRWRVALAALVIMLALDLVDVGLYIGYSLASRADADVWIRHPLFDMNHEFGLGECLEYAKSLVAAAAMLVCARRSGEAIFPVLGGLNAWLALDNAFTIHESVGEALGAALLGGHSFGLLHTRDAGEVIYFAAFATITISMLVLILRRTGPAFAPTAALLSLALVSPGVTGVFVDAFHASDIAGNFSMAMLVIVEDGGETLLMSVSCALGLGCTAHSRTWASTGRSLRARTTSP